MLPLLFAACRFRRLLCCYFAAFAIALRLRCHDTRYAFIFAAAPTPLPFRHTIFLPMLPLIDVFTPLSLRERTLCYGALCLRFVDTFSPLRYYSPLLLLRCLIRLIRYAQLYTLFRCRAIHVFAAMLPLLLITLSMPLAFAAISIRHTDTLRHMRYARLLHDAPLLRDTPVSLI